MLARRSGLVQDAFGRWFPKLNYCGLFGRCAGAPTQEIPAAAHEFFTGMYSDA
jgi:hypothetical protein